MQIIKKFLSLFMDHPRSINENYWQHLVEALTCGGVIVASGVACIIHAFFPFLFKTFATTNLTVLVNRFNKRKGIK